MSDRELALIKSIDGNESWSLPWLDVKVFAIESCLDMDWSMVVSEYISGEVA